MLFKSPVFSQASGSIAGITYSHNRGGMYTRQRVVPTDPGSSFQTAVRDAMAILSAMWQTTLTAAHREAWKTYAENVAMTNKLGDTVYLTGLQHFIRSNLPRLQAGHSAVINGPTVFSLPTYTAPTFSECTDGPSLGIAYDNSDDWAGEAGGFLFCWGSREKPPSTGYFKGPYRYFGEVTGAATPPTSPEIFTPPWAYTADNVAFCYCRIARADGRITNPIYMGPEVITT